MRDWLSRDAWAAAVARGETPDAGLRKTFVADAIEKAADETGRTVYRFVISTATPDRERDTIAVEGWKLRHYKQNPVVLWAHDYRQPPLGQAVELPKARDGKLVSGVRFDSDISEMARLIEAMVERRTLRATSVGFMALKHQMNDERRGYDFLEQELLEWSIVPVPANPEALAEAKQAGLDLAPIRRWAEQVLEGEAGPGFWIARSTLEGVWTAARAPVTHVGPGPSADAADKVVPGNVSSERADEGDAWSAPRLTDFTDQSWADLSAAERSRIARHFAWARTLPPETFGDLKLPHHRASDGKVVWRGVAAAMGALLGARGGADIPDGERRTVYGHLAAHYRAFEKEPPDFKAAPESDPEDVLAELAGPALRETGSADAVRFFLEDEAEDDITEADVRGVLAALATAAAEQAVCRLTGRVD